jgi:LPS export ABC transporter permease LptG
MERPTRYPHRLIGLLGLLALAGMLLAWLLPDEIRAVGTQLTGFPDSDAAAHRARLPVLATLCLLPPVAYLAYLRGGILDRYLIRQFLAIFGICLSALLLIWLLMDLSDNFGEFRNTDDRWSVLASFYAARCPAVLMLLLPYALLLALLQCLGKLSNHREIIAMIQSGRGVPRIALPLLIAGAFCTAFAAGINYHWAPTAEGLEDQMLAEASGRQAEAATQVLYRNPDERRLWRIGSFPPDYEKGAPLADVEVTVTRADHSIESRLSADRARWNGQGEGWTFENAVIGRHTPGTAPVFDPTEGTLVMRDWSETPWQLVKPGLEPASLGIPDLSTWLQANERQDGFADPAPYRTHWHYRWALPFSCLVMVLLATPLAMHFSRRGAGGGIFLAVCLSASMILSGTVCTAFGEAGMLPPMLSAWLPNLVFATIGGYLFQRRVSGRPIVRTLRDALANNP